MGSGPLLAWGVVRPIPDPRCSSRIWLAQAAQKDQVVSAPELLARRQRARVSSVYARLSETWGLGNRLTRIFILSRETTQSLIERARMTSSTLGDPTPPTPGLRAGTWTHITVQVREASAFLELNFSSLGTRTLNKISNPRPRKDADTCCCAPWHSGPGKVPTLHHPHPA